MDAAETEEPAGAPATTVRAPPPLLPPPLQPGRPDGCAGSHYAPSPFASSGVPQPHQQRQQQGKGEPGPAVPAAAGTQAHPSGSNVSSSACATAASCLDGMAHGSDAGSPSGAPAPAPQQRPPSPAGSRPPSACLRHSGGSGGGSETASLRSGGGEASASVRASMQAACPSEAGSTKSSVTLESVMSQLYHAAPRNGPSQCRVLLPGLDLMEHGLHHLDLQSDGGDLPVVSAPRGVDLRVAISQAISLHLETSSSSVHGAAAAYQQPQQQQGSLPGTPASLPCGLSSSGGTPLVPVRLGPSPQAGLAAADEQQQQQQQGQVGAGARHAPLPPAPHGMRYARASGGGSSPSLPAILEPGGPSAPFSGLLPSLEPPASSRVAGAEEAAGAAAAEPADAAPGGGAQGERPRATTWDQLDLLPGEPPPVRLAGGRPWSYDGAASTALLSSPRALRPSPIDIAYRARAAARMWPMLAPFVPRMLRRYILRSHPPPGSSLVGDGSPVHDSIGKALASKAAAPPQSLSRVMRPCMDTFPAAVMVADVSGFTALTETLGAKGSAGVELLTKCMNRYFTQVIDLLLLYGGDVEKFAGDCMIVVFVPTLAEVAGSDDGGLAAATLRAVTCGAELTERFGAMRMLPNGEVVAIPAAERWAAEDDAYRQAAADAGTPTGEGQGRLHQHFDTIKDMIGAAPNLLARPTGRALSVAHGSARVAAHAAGSGARMASMAAGSSAKAAASALGKAAAAPQRRLRSASASIVQRASGKAPASAFAVLAAVGSLDASPDISRSSSMGSGLLRCNSSPDGRLLAEAAGALAAGEGKAVAAPEPLPQSPLSPVRAIVRQGRNLASAVMSRLSRSSSPGVLPGRSLQQAGHQGSGGAPAAEGQEGMMGPEASAGTSGSGGDAAAGAARDASDERLQRERRLHEQALAELVVLAGPASALRPPELPSAAGTAEAAEQRYQEQLAQYRRTSLPHARLAKTAGISTGLRPVSRTSTAPPDVGDLLSSIAAEHQRQMVQQADPPPHPTQRAGGPGALTAARGSSSGSGEQAPVRSVAGSPSKPAQGMQQLASVPSGSALELEKHAEHASDVAAAMGSSQDLEPFTSATSAAATQLLLNDSAHQGGPGDWGTAAAPSNRSAAWTTQLKRRPSVVRRLLSAAAGPWRGRSVSSSPDAQHVAQAGDASVADCQDSSMSGASLAPWSASLAELSNGLGLPGTISPSSCSPPSVSRFGGHGQDMHRSLDLRRSYDSRHSHGSRDWRRSYGGAASGVAPTAAAALLQGSTYAHVPPPASAGDAWAGATLPQAYIPSALVQADVRSGEGGGGQQPAQGPAMQQQVLLSLKVMVAAGTACAFHVGGGQDSAFEDVPGLPRWEFFIGDPPQPAEDDGDPQRPRPPIWQLRTAEQYAISGEVVLSPEVVDLVGGSCLLEPLGDGNACLLQLLDAYQLPPEVQEEADSGTSLEQAAKQIARERAALAALPEVAQGHALQLMRMHLLENVRIRVEAGHIDYVNELRVGTVLFLGFPSLLEPPPRTGSGTARTGLGAVQACMEVVQKRMRQHDGSFLQFRCDEKGFLAICAFGLPGRSHEDGPARGIQAALAIVEAVKRRGGRACCGVTTGQLFCAMVGSQRRSEYTVFGNAINLSARLMVRARDRFADVYCDATTQQLAKNKAVYRQLDAVRVKGRQQPVEIFEVASLDLEGATAPGQRLLHSPLGPQPLPAVPPVAAAAAVAAAAGLTEARSRRSSFAPSPQQRLSGAVLGSGGALESLASALAPQLLQLQPQAEELPQAPTAQGSDSLGLGDRLLSIASTAAAPIKLAPNAPMIARESELAAITERCVELVQQKRGGVVMVEGEAGMGKSRLVEELQQSELGGVYDSCNLFLGLGRRERKSQALYPWRRVLREMFHHDRQLGQVYCLKDLQPTVVVTELALRLQEGVPDFAQWRHLLADALELPLSEFPAALPTPEQHRKLLLEQRHLEGGSPPQGLQGSPPHLDFLEAAQQLAATVSTSPGALLHSAEAGLGEEEEAFLSGPDRARSFAARMKRSASLTLGMLAPRHHDHGTWEVQDSGRSQSPTVSELDRLRATATPSPRKMSRILKQQEVTVWQQAKLAAAAAERPALLHGAPSSVSSGDGSGSDSSSDSGSYSSSPASSFTGSVHSIPGTPTTAQLGSEGGGDGSARLGSSSLRGKSRNSSLGRGRGQQPWPMQRSVTSRAGVLALRSSTPAREISTHLRAKKVQELVVAVIREFIAAYGPLVLVLEDLHHFDTASWRLLTTAIGDEVLRQSVLFILTYRPNFGALSPALRQRPGGKELRYHRVQVAYRTLLAQPSALHLVLQPFNVEQSCQFVSAALGGAQVPPEVAVLLWERSNGLPSFLEQLVVFLQLFVQTQLQTAANGEVGILRPGRHGTVEEVQAVAQAGLDFIRNNVSINSIITDRVDRLRPEEQLTLKVASVLGLTIYRQLLQATHPQHPPLPAVEASLCALEAATFLRQDPQDVSTWRFCQVLARDVVYEMVPKELRRDWHAAAAAAMEAFSSAQFRLPPSTIAWHWSQSCRDVEASQWQRSFHAVEWWERSAAASLDNGGYADALPLLQKAQDVAAALEDYFTGHSRSFFLMHHQSLLASSGAASVAEAMGSLLLAGASTGLTADTAASTRGSAMPPVLSGSANLLPLVPRLRRAHWERCMAAMCIAAEATDESVHDAKAHCLLALHLLGVPLPSSEEFWAWQAAQQHWWSGPRLWGALPACACASADEDPLQRRVADLEGGAYAWMARPDAALTGSADPSGRGSQSRGKRRGMPAAGPATLAPARAAAGVLPRSNIAQLDSGGHWQLVHPSAAAQKPSPAGRLGTDGKEQQQAPAPSNASAAGTHSGADGSSDAFGSFAAWPSPAAGQGGVASGAFGSISLSPTSAGQQPHADRMLLGVAAGDSRALLHPSPFELPLAAALPAAAATAPPPAETEAACGTAALPAVAQAGGLTAAAGDGLTLLRPRSSHLAALLDTAAAANSAAGRRSGAPPLPLQQQPTPQLSAMVAASSQQQRQSDGYRRWEAAGLLAAAEAGGEQQEQVSQPQPQPPPPQQQPQQQQPASLHPHGDVASMSVGPAFSARASDLGLHEQHAAVVQQHQEQVQKRAVAFGLAGRDERYSPLARAEAAVVLDLLCSLLVAQPQVDVEGLRYVRWACTHLQGGRVRRRSPYRHICADAGLALRRAGSAVRRDGTAGAAAGLPSLLHSLSSMARRVLPQRGSRTAAAGKSTGSQ